MIEQLLAGIYLLIAIAILIYTGRDWKENAEKGEEPPNLFMIAMMWGPLLAFGALFYFWMFVQDWRYASRK